MFRFLRPVAYYLTCRSRTRYARVQQPLIDLQKVKIVCLDDDDVVKISFRYGTMPHSQNTLTFKTFKEEQLSDVLSKIKTLVSAYRKKEELRRVSISRLSGIDDVIEPSYEDVDVSLIYKDKPVENIKNVDAWADGSHLKIGDLTYEVNLNLPTVFELSLPKYIVAGCFIRPHFSLECANKDDSVFLWYRSAETFDEEEGGRVVDDASVNWEKVSEGFIYTTTHSDVGKIMKVVCLPKCGEASGMAVATVSENPVLPAPDLFPFEERHLYTRDLVDSDCIRCTSYNVLANIYVETKKFPYTSRKARDPYYRKQLLLKELLGYNSDIICMQEVQERMFEHDLLPVLQKVGLRGTFIKKGGRRYEGLAMFYRSSKLRIVSQNEVFLNEVVKDKNLFNDLLSKVPGYYKDISKLLAQDTTLQIVVLEHAECSSHRVLVANTHLYSNKDTPEVRLIQAALCTYYIEHMLKAEKDPSSVAVIFCGDFNSVPDSATFNFITNGSFKLCSNSENSSVVEGNDTTLRHSLSFDSACGIPAYTNYTEEFYGCLDYIFYNKDILDVTEIVPMPRHEAVTEKVALPSELFPSDHIALVCTLKWKRWDNDRV